MLEVLVALAIFGLLLVALTQGIQFGLLAGRSAARIGAANHDLNEIDLALRHLIQAIDPAPARQNHPSLVGGRDEMAFVTELPNLPAGMAGDPGLHRQVEAALVVDARHRLVLRWRLLHIAVTPAVPPPIVETALLNGISRMDLSFWRPEGGWADVWAASELPAMVRIHLVFENSLARHWPDIVAAPLVQGR